MDLEFSIIIPVYNRPAEVDELLHSLCLQDYKKRFQVIIVEDGSNISSKEIVDKYLSLLEINYFVRENAGPGASRNFGMKQANGNYYIILDSDCVLPEHYLKAVEKALLNRYTEAYGGADTSHSSFSTIQKAIGHVMTAVLTTGGIRGHKKTKDRFQPRSFNMGLSKKAFMATGGFGDLNFGEDIDLSLRLWEQRFNTQFIEDAYVYHKRRVTWASFYKQTHSFGSARPILNRLHPGTGKITYWFPSLFILGIFIALIGYVLGLLGLGNLSYFLGSRVLLGCYLLYFLILFLTTFFKHKSIHIALKSIYAALVMFFGYGLGFLRSIFNLYILRKSDRASFPEMFR